MNNQQNYQAIRRKLLHQMTVVMMLLSLILTGQPSTPVLAATNIMTLQVISATDATPITAFNYIINKDNTGTTEQRGPNDPLHPGCSPEDVGYPNSCNWVSIAGVKSSSPILTQGNQDDFTSGLNLPDGKYLISVLADGYKIDGAHFTVPFTDSGLVTVKMQPYNVPYVDPTTGDTVMGLPDGTIQAEVFEDSAPTNSAPDVPAERGIAGFTAHIADYIDEVTTDVYGDPLCGNNHCMSKCYAVDGGVDIGTVDPIDADGRCPFRDELPADAMTVDTGHPISEDAVIEGKVIIPNLGPNRYALSVVPPNGTDWAQTTTLEGNHDWDSWVMEGATGLDTEFVVAGEPFPATFFGYVKPTNTMASGSGEIKGIALAVSAYIPPAGGIVGETGLLGAKPKDVNPIHRLFVSLSDLNNNDQTVYMHEFDCVEPACDPVNFDITGVPDGDYVLGVWDEPQDYIFLEQNVSVQNGELVDLGSLSMLGWWSTIDGYVFADTNENGIKDPGEQGVPNFAITMRTRENSLMDRGATTVTTDANGYYWMENAYPITQWLVEEAYIEGLQTTGVTYQADNQSEPTTILGQGVDVNVHPVIGLGAHLDWGVKAYDPGTNGGIVGTVSYDTTRNELDPAYSVLEDWQPGISGLTVDLYAPIACPYDPVTFAQQGPCDPTGSFQLNSDGSYATGALLNQYVTETWQRPQGCVARDVNNNPLVYGADQQVLPHGGTAVTGFQDQSKDCIEAPMMGMQFGPMSDGTNFGASVDGNYGFGDGCFATGFNSLTGACNNDGAGGHVDPTALPSNSDFLVKVEIPTEGDMYGPTAVHPNQPLYKVTKEEDVNIGNGDSFVPQVPPSACAGPLHTVDVAGFGTDGYGSVDLFGDGSVIVPASSPVYNPTFAQDVGGSPYEGQPKPLCNMKLVHVSDRRSVAPGFNLFTDVPLPGRFWGLIVDDLNFSSNPKSTAYGEKLPLAFNPIGIYDYTNRLIDTVESDYNGYWDVLLPSTNRISCPTPSGVCANLYRFVGNDPGTPGSWNPTYNPQYRTISAEFEAFPGLTLPADLAPTPVAVAVQIPGLQTIQPVSCTLNDMTGTTPVTTPEFFAINKPYMYRGDSGVNRRFTLQGLGFGSAQGSVNLDNLVMPIISWSDTEIQFRVPSGGSNPNTPTAGPHQLKITTADDKTTINALTFHVVAGNSGNSGNTNNNNYNLKVFEVGVGKAYDPTDPAHNTPIGEATGPYEHALQDALNDAAAVRKALVVVYPGPVDGTNPRYNGRGAWYESLVMHSSVKLQGVGPGGVYPAGMGLPPIQGSIIDGIAFGGDTNMALGWRELVYGLTRAGNQDISEGQVIYVLPETTDQFGSRFNASIDGLDIRGGDQFDMPGNLNAIFGGFPGPAEAANVETQGGAIFANSDANYLQITNNIVENNGGNYGAIRIGTPNIDASLNNNHNVRITNNRILANGGTNLAGAIGLFGGSDNYTVASNDICGNFSAEYGGGISHFGLSPNGSIHDNRIYFNHSYDEGAGIIIAGELATNPAANYGEPGGPQGSGAVNIYNNILQANMAEDDGGGLRFLMSGNFPMNVYNNMIVNNVSMHEGGGVAIDDASNVRFYNNTVMRNKTTATAVTSNGLPAPAGLSTGANSNQLQATLPGGSPLFSDPLLFNNIFWNNWAGTKGIDTVTGITPLDPDPWDMGVVGTSSDLLSPTYSILQPSAYPGAIGDGSNSNSDPAVASAIDIPLSFTSWRTNVNFVGAIMATADLPPNLLSDYHLTSGSATAIDLGAINKSGIDAPVFDIDNGGRPTGSAFDIGADEYLSPLPPPPPSADLSISVAHSPTTLQAGSTVTYLIGVSNIGPDAVSGATVVDNLPADLSNATWTCSASLAASSCPASGSGNISTSVDIAANGSLLFTVSANISAAATGSLSNTASVTAPSGVADPDTSNNSATDVASIQTGQTSIHVGDLEGSGVLANGANWRARVTVTVHDSSEGVVPGATVTLTVTRTRKSNGSLAVRTRTCVTNSHGTCSVTQTVNSNNFEDDVSFIVTNVTASGYTYQASDNHDVNGNSDGTAITVNKP